MNLYHGTSAIHLPSIFKHGIHPRKKKTGNWSLNSNPNNVYLTIAYPFFFAQTAADDGEDLAIIELDSEAIKENLCADEDAIEQSRRGVDNLPQEWDMKRRTIYYRTRAHLYSAGESLLSLGTCAHVGTIPARAIRRAIRIDANKIMHFVMSGFDPVISTVNFHVMGERYARANRWMFGDEPECALNPNLTRDGIHFVKEQ